jgi:hypothetical protein
MTAGMIARTLPARIQERLSRWYGIDDAPSVDAFIEPSDDERETLFVRDEGGELELLLRLPRSVIGERRAWSPVGPTTAPHPARSRALTFDELCQAIEGVSHFLYLAERARRELPATHLELELQAEVDKYVLLSHGAGRFHPARAQRVRARLFERVSYLHAEDTEHGQRYRMANDLAARFARRLEELFARHGKVEAMRAALRRFYGAGQAEKIELARAA